MRSFGTKERVHVHLPDPRGHLRPAKVGGKVWESRFGTRSLKPSGRSLEPGMRPQRFSRVSRYQEANPALFTLVTFPFLFGVMRTKLQDAFFFWRVFFLRAADAHAPWSVLHRLRAQEA